MKEKLAGQKRKKISGELFKKLFLCNSVEQFENYKNLHSLHDIPIYRLSSQEIFDKTDGTAPGESSQKYTAAFDVDIIGDIKIDDLQDHVENPLFCFNSKISNIDLKGSNTSINSWEFFNCDLESIKLCEITITNLSIIDSTVEEVRITNGEVKNIHFHNCKNISILLVAVNVFSFLIFNAKNIKGVYIEKESAINDFHLKGTSTSEFIQCFNSNIHTLNITEKSTVAGVFFNKGCQINRININKSRVHNIEAYNSKLGNVKILSSILSGVQIYNTEIFQTLSINDCTLNNLISVANRSNVRRVYIYYTNGVGFDFSRSEIRYIKIHQSFLGAITTAKCNMGNVIATAGSKIGDLTAEKCFIDYIQLSKQFGSIILTGTDVPLICNS